jgi:hypothetical protein
VCGQIDGQLQAYPLHVDTKETQLRIYFLAPGQEVVSISGFRTAAQSDVTNKD